MKRWMRDNCPPIVVAVCIIVLFSIAIIFAVRDEQTWERFKLEHDCKIVSEESAQVVVGTVNGKSSTHVTPGKKTWLCNDGVKYTR